MFDIIQLIQKSLFILNILSKHVKLKITKKVTFSSIVVYTLN